MPGSGPIFVTGPARSGKTLLRCLLTSHPSIALARRTELWPLFAGRHGDLADDRALDRCLAALAAREQVAALGCDLDRLRAEFRRGPRTDDRLLGLLLQHHAAAVGKPRWGEQSEGAARHAARILAAYPGARFVHMVRDPRDRYLAEVERGGRRPGGALRSGSRWRVSREIARRNRHRFPDAYMVLRYEDLVHDLDTTLRRVCAFLGERYDPRMPALPGVHRYDAERGTAPGASPVSPAGVGRWRGRLAPAEVLVIEALAGGALRADGYAPAGGHGTAGAQRRWA